MPSENARAVALEVSETVRKGKKVVLGKIIAKRYAKSTSQRPKQVTETKSYKEAMKPLIDRLEEERNAIIERLKKTRTKAKYRDLIDGLDKVTKNIQLLSGKPTDRTDLTLTDEQRRKIIRRETERFAD